MPLRQQGDGYSIYRNNMFRLFLFQSGKTSSIIVCAGVAGAFDRSKQNQEATHDRVENNISRHRARSDFLDPWRCSKSSDSASPPLKPDSRAPPTAAPLPTPPT